MDEPPRKRRKTSSPVRASSSPLRKPPRRPSFASPTKASLARNYPELLPTRTPPRKNFRTGGEQARTLALDGAEHSPRYAEKSHEEPADPQASQPHNIVEVQEVPRRGVLLSSPSKRPPRAVSATRRSPLAEAPAVQQNQRTRRVEEALDTDGLNKKTRKFPLDPEFGKRKQEKARLQREVQELEAQVSRCTNEIAVEQQRAEDASLLPAQRADLM